MQCTPGDTTKWKQEAGYTNPEDYDNPNVQIVSCDNNGNKYALDVAKVQGQQIATAPLSCPRRATSGKSC